MPVSLVPRSISLVSRKTTLILKETIDYYSANRSTILCTMLDATKAFDRVQYCKLFHQLLGRNLPAIILQLLVKLYTCQVTRVV